MPKKKNTKKSQVKASEKDTADKLSYNLRLKDSYVSLFLGILVVVIAIVLGALLIKNKGYLNNPSLSGSGGSATPAAMNQRTYTVQEGEDLWGISQKIYGSGFNWVDIVKENNLQSPDAIYTGMVLRIPDVPKRDAP